MGEVDTTSHRDSRRWLTPGVASVGIASLCSDSSHEMVTALLPGFVTSTLGGGPASLAAIDGVADALTGLSKLAGGPLAADPGRRGKQASGGYIGTAVATAAIGLTTAVWQVAILRSLAWISRGLRSPARDTVLTDLADPGSYGRAFGFERAGDNIGAIAGPLLAAALVGVLGVRTTMYVALIPGLLAAVAITIAVREARAQVGTPTGRRTLGLNLHALHEAGMARVLIPIAAFELGNLATTLLILRATGLLEASGWTVTRATSVAILVYAGHNAVAAGASLLAGSLSDRRGPRLTFALAGAVYMLGYVVFALPGGMAGVVAGFALAGIGIGLGETAESAVVALSIPQDLRSRAFGLLGLTQAVGDIGATVVAGLLWSGLSASVAFGYAAAWMALSVVTLTLVRVPSIR